MQGGKQYWFYLQFETGNEGEVTGIVCFGKISNEASSVLNLLCLYSDICIRYSHKNLPAYSGQFKVSNILPVIVK